MKNKDEVLNMLKNFVADVLTPAGHEMKRFHSDGAGEYTCGEMVKYLADNKVTRTTSTPYRPHQNGIAERAWRETIEKAVALLIAAGLPERYWTHAVDTATYCINRTPSRVLDSKSPLEAWTGEKPDLSNMRIFGSLAFIKDRHKQNKLTPKASLGVFVGYSMNSPGYHIRICENLRTTIDVDFDEATMASTKLNLQRNLKERDHQALRNFRDQLAVTEGDEAHIEQEPSLSKTNSIHRRVQRQH